MPTSDPGELRSFLHAVADHAADWLETLDERPIPPRAGADELRERLQPGLGDAPTPAREVIDRLAAEVEPGLMAMGSPRFFGWVIGGALPAALGADWLTAAWDQNAGLASPTPASAVVEELAGARAAELLGLPAGVSFAVVTGCQMAHVTALAAARHRVLERAGWDVESDGLAGAPPIRVIAGDERHITVDRALRLLGLGRLQPIPSDSTGAMRADVLAEAIDAATGPTIVCAQAGNVNTGAVDPLERICALAHDRGAWVHVDGAFGLWAAASPARRAAVAGIELADSWATDGHKWLNVPYDCGLAFVADTEAHRAAMAATAGYLPAAADGGPRSPMDWTPEFSRRGRGFALYAALATLGRDGVAELVDRLCACAERFAEALRAEPGVEVLASGLNQVLVRWSDDDATDGAVAALQREGTCYATPTIWHGRHALRISVSNYKTTFAEVDRSLEAIQRPARITA
jgi:glutamate/tyrosine decarboxylase-like PLP-dependent enzyme